ncbi:MAG: response regulator [bacterium]|nr:response regulator [bacterium]
MSLVNDRQRREDLDVLLIEDDADDRALVREILAEVCLGPSGAGRCRQSDAATLAEALAILGETSFDVILLDLHLPDAAGLEALVRVTSAQGLAPVLILTDLHDEAAGLAAVREGAQDFLVKDRLDGPRLGRAIAYAIERHRMRREVAIRARELSASEDRLRRLIAAAPDGIVITDREGVVAFCNPAAEVLFNRPRSALIGSPLGLPVDGSRNELELRRPDGRPLTAEMRVAPVEWLGLPGYLANFRDISAHKETLQQLDDMRVRQIMVRDQFLSHVSHELRTPLTVAQQWVALLRDGLIGAVSDEQKTALETVLRNCRHLEKLIEDLLEAQRSETGKLRVEPLRAPLRGLVDDAIASVRAAQRTDTVRFGADLPNALPDLLADPGRIRQVLINLLSNAARFTPADGSITVTAMMEPHAPGEMRVSVNDTGCGIPPAEQERIFEHLYQRETETEIGRRGLGLGLYICRQIVTQHGGRIWLDSTEGRGSTFHFTVPVFSCRAMLAKLPVHATGGGALCLVGIDARPVGGPLQAFEVRYLDAMRRVAGECLMPDRDLLLPRLTCDEQGELAFIVATADAAGTAVLVDRLRNQLEAAGDTGATRLDFRFDAAPLAVVPRIGRATDAWLDEAALALQDELERMTRAAGRQLD